MAIAKVEPLTRARALRGPFDYRLPPEMAGLAIGSVVVVPFGRRRVLGVVVDLAEASDLPPERLAEPIEALAAGAPTELVRLGLWIAREYCSTPARGLELVLPPGTATEGRRALRRLETGGRPRRSRAIEADARSRLEPTAAPPLSADQVIAVDATLAAMEGRGPRELLLYGVTGSGKTEVYLASVAAALERGRGAIVLVPEIALTPQTVGRFEARFGERVALLHSRLAGGERRRAWERLRSGEARVCVGPRSAVMAPVSELGLIVIDEEHDSSYKQEGDPRYDARHVAAHRAAEAGAALLAGSATPRPESWAALERLTLPSRVDGIPLPDVELLDMRSDGRARRAGPLHSATVAALGEVVQGGGKAIVLLNRRGWSPFLECRDCGHAFECPECDVTLVVHRNPAALRCHHCGRREEHPERCPECGSVTLARHGSGTQRVEALLAEAVDPLPVFRLDSDSASGAGAHAEILGRFAAAPAGVLLGTQMVAKGHDFPDVVLGVVLDADATLRFPDFRAEERTFALVAQLAGRSGRGQRGGRVLVQTRAPEAPALRHAAQHDAPGFLRAELERRRELAYPPFSHLVRVDLSGSDQERVEAAAAGLAGDIAPGLPGDAALLGPAPRLRLRGRHRRQLLVKSPAREGAIGAVRDAVEAAAAARRLREIAVSVDVDPQ